MQKCRHIFENRIYLIRNRSVEGNPLFLNDVDQKKFIAKVEQYLSPISDILGISVHQNQFEIVLRIGERRKLVKFFKETHKGKTNEKFFIPLSTHIFSRQMSNMQVSVAKKYNFENKRKGALFASRFERVLIESENELKSNIRRLKNKVPFYNNVGTWLKKLKENKFEALKPISYAYAFEQTEMEEISVLTELSTHWKNNLGGCFDGLMKVDYLDHILRKMMIDFRIKYPCGPNYN